MTTLVFDIGGTNMRMALYERGKLGKVEKAPTPREAAEAVAILKNFVGARALEKVSGGVPGVVQGGVIVRAPNLPGWSGFSFKDAFSVPVCLTNDAAIEALGEACEGAGKDARIVAYLTIGTGVGGALVVDRTIAPHAVGFEPGHQIVDLVSGKDLEAAIGGRALGAELGRAAHLLPQAIYDARTPLLAAGIHNLIRFWSPDVVVLGGAVLLGTPGFRWELLEKEVVRLANGQAVPPIVRGVLGDRAGLIGAAAL